MINMVFALENTSTAQYGPPYSWPAAVQPDWLQVGYLVF